MKTKRTLIKTLATLCILGGLAACDVSDTVTVEIPGQDVKIQIGILQPVEHPALGAAKSGFEAGLKEKIGNREYAITYLNAGGNDADEKNDAKNLVDTCHLTFGIGTSSAQALKNASIAKGYTKPVIFSAVTDPVDAGLVADKDAPEGFVTGSSDMNPVDDQIALIKEIIPTIKKIGIMYTAKEVNSVVQSNMAQAKAKALGLETVVKTVDNTGEIATTATALITAGAEAIYLPTDNNIAANMNAIKSAADQGHVLVMCGEEGMVNSGGHISLSVDYFNLGKCAGEMAAEIITGAKELKNVPVKYMGTSECKYVYDSKNLQDSGITISDSIMAAHSWEDVNA